MVVLSTSCKCSACMKKYDCPIYKKIVQMQKLTKDFADCEGIIIRFQTEGCSFRISDEGGK